MSATEVAHRARYRLATAVERRQHQRGTLAPHDRLQRGLVPALRGQGWRAALLEARRSPVSTFYAGTSHRTALRELFATQFSRELASTLDAAARARAHRFEFFGREYQYGSEIDWHADPVTQVSWPRIFHADVPVHGGDVGFGDVKHVWELSRQQYLIDLAKSFYLANREDDLAAMCRLVRSWIAGNPYATGVNWSCALEPAFRVWSWLWAYHLTSEALDDEFHIEWLRGFYDHGRFLHRHLEHYSSPYNHLIGEAAALYALGICFPEFAEARQWRDCGRRVLEDRLDEQFYPDGGSVEQSTFYHHATTGFYLLAAILARQNGEELSSRIWSAIERGIEFSMHLAQPDGRTPEIGGADDGKPIRFEHLPFWDFRPYQAIGAVLFRRSDFKFVAGKYYEDAVWLLGPAGVAEFESLGARPPDGTSVVLAASGYMVSRSSWTSDADYVCFDVGEQAAGMRTDAIPNSMHGHADALSVVVSLGGRRVLVDSGLYAYNCGGEWEAHFRETAAHNTARIDGCDQARHLGKMAWSHSYRTSIGSRMLDERQAWVVGSHDGYARGPEGVTHTRTIWRRPGGYVVMHDEFIGAGRHEIEVIFQFAPGNLALGDGRAMFDGFAELTWFAHGPWQPEHRCGGTSPSDGWVCTSLGVRQAAPRLVLKGAMDGSTSRVALLTVLTGSQARVRPVTDKDLSGIAVLSDRFVDWVVARNVGPNAPLETDGRLAIARIGPGGPDCTAADATTLHVRSDAIDRLMSALSVRAAAR